MDQRDTSHTDHHKTHFKVIGVTAGIAGGIIAAPYALPAIGIGTTELAKVAMDALHATEPLGVGNVGIINGILNKIPVIGPEIATGGMAAAYASGVIGIGGILLSKWLEKREAEQGNQSKWPPSRIIKYVALGTSILIALPAIMTGISLGVTFLSALIGGSATAGSTAATFMTNIFGAMGSMESANSSANLIATTLPHLLICGAAIVPAALALFMGRSSKKEAAPEPVEETPNWQARIAQPKEKPAAIAASM